MHTARELMIPAPLRVTPEASIAECATLLVRHQAGHLLVVDDDGHLAGIVTDMAVFRHGAIVPTLPWMWMYFRPDETGDLVATELLEPAPTVAPSTDLATALRTLAGSASDCAVVVEDGVPVGVLSAQDAVRFARGVVRVETRVRDAFTSPLLSVPVESPARDALEVMRQHRVRHIALTHGGRVVGVVSYRDLYEDAVGPQSSLTAHDVQRGTSVFTVSPHAALRDAAVTMARHRIGCLPVVHGDGRGLGMVTRTDVCRAAADALAAAD